MGRNLDLSTVTATHQRPEDTCTLVESLHTSLEQFRDSFVDAEMTGSIVVVCSQESDETLSRLRKQKMLELTVIESASHRPADNRDRGIRHVDSEYVASIDSDCVVAEDWFEQVHSSLLDAEPDVIQGGYYWDYPPQRNWVTRFEANEDEIRFSNDALDTRNLIIRRSVYFEMGGFGAGHEYATGGDDLVLPARLDRINADIRTAADVKVYHKYPRTVWKNVQRRLWYGHGAWYARTQYPSMGRQQVSFKALASSATESLAWSILGKNDDRTVPQSIYYVVMVAAFAVGYIQALASEKLSNTLPTSQP